MGVKFNDDPDLVDVFNLDAISLSKVYYEVSQGVFELVFAGAEETLIVDSNGIVGEAPGVFGWEVPEGIHSVTICLTAPGGGGGGGGEGQEGDISDGEGGGGGAGGNSGVTVQSTFNVIEGQEVFFRMNVGGLGGYTYGTGSSRDGQDALAVDVLLDGVSQMSAAGGMGGGGGAEGWVGGGGGIQAPAQVDSAQGGAGAGTGAGFAGAPGIAGNCLIAGTGGTGGGGGIRDSGGGAGGGGGVGVGGNGAPGDSPSWTIGVNGGGGGGGGGGQGGAPFSGGGSRQPGAAGGGSYAVMKFRV